MGECVRRFGAEVRALFSPNVQAPYREKYHEIGNQKVQVEEFWKAEDDVIVIGEEVMKWFTQELADQVDTTAPARLSQDIPGRHQVSHQL